MSANNQGGPRAGKPGRSYEDAALNMRIRMWANPDIADIINGKINSSGSWLIDFLETEKVHRLDITATILSALQDGIERGWFVVRHEKIEDDGTFGVEQAFGAPGTTNYEEDRLYVHGTGDLEDHLLVINDVEWRKARETVRAIIK